MMETAKDILNDLDWLKICLDMSHTAWCDKDAWEDDFTEREERIRRYITDHQAQITDLKNQIKNSVYEILSNKIWKPITKAKRHIDYVVLTKGGQEYQAFKNDNDEWVLMMHDEHGDVLAINGAEVYIIKEPTHYRELTPKGGE